MWCESDYEENKMGSSTSKFINDAGSVIGGIIAAPFKSIFGQSCE